MKIKVLACAVAAVALTVSPAMAAKKMKRSGHHHAHHHMHGHMHHHAHGRSMPGAVVGGAAGVAGAVVGGAVATAGAIATAPIMLAPVSTLNGPTCKAGTMVTINGKRMRCQ
ncbi:MAG: hypothetical protein R3D69_08090 [Xanthobacteraceae bacterium]